MMRAVGNRLGIGFFGDGEGRLAIPWQSDNDVFLDLGVQVAATSCQATAMVLGLLWLLWFVSRGPKLLEVEDTTFR